MNKRQLKAIDRVKRAMASAEREGIAFAGLGGALRMFSLQEFKRCSNGSSPEEITGVIMQDYETYFILDTA